MHSFASYHHTLYDTRHDLNLLELLVGFFSGCKSVSCAYPRPGEGDLRERIPLLTSSSAVGRDARSLSSLSYISARVCQRGYHLPRAYSSPTLPSFQQEHLQVGLRISSFYVSFEWTYPSKYPCPAIHRQNSFPCTTTPTLPYQ
jgi:hypothetical protein